MLNLESLNEAQRKAVTHGTGPLLVLAGPGSGKTYTITQRIFYLIERLQVPPEKILVITFTKEAALAMQSRFRQSSEQILPVNFGTFHSVFYHILRESHILQTNQILTLNQKKAIVIPILKNYISTEETDDRQRAFKQSNSVQVNLNQSDSKQNGLSQGNMGQNDLSEIAIQFLAAIGYYKNTGDSERAAKKLSGEWQECFKAVMTSYEQIRERQGGIDFDDMVYECRKLLQKDAGLRKYWQGRFDAILIDEFQDISPMQYEVVGLLAGAHHNVFAVGDDDQSIYGFRGAKPACLKRFVEEYHAEKICLNINYRSKPGIVQAANLVIGENKERFAKELYAVQPQREEKDVCLKSFPEREEQYHYLIEKLKEILTDVPHPIGSQGQIKQYDQENINSANMNQIESIGVLFRTNTYMQGFAARLHREGIPYVMREKAVNIYEHFIAKDIMAYLRLSRENYNKSIFLQVMNKPSRYISREALGEGKPDYNHVIRYYQKDENMLNYSMRQGVIREVEKWKRQMKYLAGLSPFTAVSYIRKAIGYEKFLRERADGNLERQQEWEELLEWLSADAANYATAEEWIEAQEDYAKALEKRETNIVKSLNRKEKSENICGKNIDSKVVINLMTAHASKGLEFDRVYVPDCNEKIFPHGTMQDEETCEEERRVFYVAMTRAKKSLKLLYLTGTKERPRLPSRFLNKLL